jgi:sugar phosphate isomerase/epimerase
MRKQTMRKFPFRIGTTSYIIPDEILPNAHYLSSMVDDIELVLFEVDDGPSNLPDNKTLLELKELAQKHELTYTVHLPLDLRLAGDNGEQHVSLIKAKRVIDCTRSLDPFAYVLHLDGRELLPSASPEVWERWNCQAVQALRVLSDWVGDYRRLAVENLENYPLHTWDDAVQSAPAGRCIDIGHLWRDGHDPIQFLKDRIHKAGVIHIHGIAERDHNSLTHVPRPELERIVRYLVFEQYQGVVTIEVFSEADFHSSMEAIDMAMDGSNMEDEWADN